LKPEGRSSFEKPLRFSKSCLKGKEDLDIIGANLESPPGFSGSKD
jgi:hypothetical protein